MGIAIDIESYQTIKTSIVKFPFMDDFFGLHDGKIYYLFSARTVFYIFLFEHFPIWLLHTVAFAAFNVNFFAAKINFIQSLVLIHLL